MLDATKEKALETYIQETMTQRGWLVGSCQVWDQQMALFPGYILSFIQATQPRLWKEMEQLHQDQLSDKLIESVVKERNTKGTLHILRHGFKFYGKTFRLAFFQPTHHLVPENMALFAQNQLHVTRQVPCHPQDTSTIDMVLSLNGIPVATLELKNPGTHQTWQNAVQQYKTDRDPGAPLFLFKKGALVHFAVDTQEVHTTTRLDKDKTVFLPFNRGSHPGEIDCGKGNPQHPSGHRTAYLWEDILERESFLDILSNFIFLESRDEIVEDQAGTRQRVTQESMVFPRFHQLDCIRKLVALTKQERASHYYLIQHSAGSGKTNSIAWLAHRLASLHTNSNEKIFDCVIVVTDRKVLDRQLQDAVYQIEHAQGVVQAIDDNACQLADSLLDGTKIVITTLQKFPFILRGLLHIAGAKDVDHPDEMSQSKSRKWQSEIAKRNYAVIIDEAHSSQTGETARQLKKILGARNPKSVTNEDAHKKPQQEPAKAASKNPRQEPDENEEMTWEDGLYAVMQSRGRQKNLSFFAFTATPKGKTLELFGRIGPSGKPEPLHTYSMKQAIEEGFILDVLQRYTTYKVHFQLIKKIEDDPSMPKKKAIKKLSKFMILHPHNIEQKTETIIEHFRAHVRHKLNGRGKAMVVTSSRLHAVRYMLSFQKYIAENHYHDIRPLVAFSGAVIDNDTGLEYTEPGMNIDVVTGKSISESQLPEKFDSSDYNILLVANKYQTGFDQPLLCAMYVDKRLDGVQAVQTLSRLNRTSPGKEPPFILDFVNEANNIALAFQPYYHTTMLQDESDPQHLEQLKHELDAMQVYLWSEVEAFCRIFYLPPSRQNPSDHGRMKKFVQPAVDRFHGLDKEGQNTFYEKITAYIRFYAFISQIIPYSDQEMEMLYSYLRALAADLKCPESSFSSHPERDVKLEYYRMEKTMSGQIVMEDGESYGVKSPTEVGTSQSMDENKPLSEIIQALNERFGTQFTEEDRLFLEQIQSKASKDERVTQLAQSNSLDNFRLGIKAILEALMVQRMAENDSMVTRYMKENEFQQMIFQGLSSAIYKKILK